MSIMHFIVYYLYDFHTPINREAPKSISRSSTIIDFKPYRSKCPKSVLEAKTTCALEANLDYRNGTSSFIGKREYGRSEYTQNILGICLEDSMIFFRTSSFIMNWGS